VLEFDEEAEPLHKVLPIRVSVAASARCLMIWNCFQCSGDP
jgi:hypothetical protein